MKYYANDRFTYFDDKLVTIAIGETVDGINPLLLKELIGAKLISPCVSESDIDINISINEEHVLKLKSKKDVIDLARTIGFEIDDSLKLDEMKSVLIDYINASAKDGGDHFD